MDIGTSIQQAVTLAQAGRAAEAITLMQGAVRDHPDHAQGLGLLATLLSSMGRHAEALPPLQRARELAPGLPHLAYHLGAVLVALNRPLEGLPHMQRAVELNSAWMPGLLGFARALQGVGDFDRAEGVYRRAMEVDPRSVEAQGSLAGMLILSGRVSEAVDLFRRTAREHPRDLAVQGRLLSALNYADDATPEETLEAHEHWGRLVMALGTDSWTPSADRNPNRRLRVGLLSTDLWDHSVAYFLRPILSGRDSSRLEFICYSASATSDWMTQVLKNTADGWRDVAGLEGPALTERLRTDRLDVLIELNGHTANGPLASLRNRAAPVQATYLGYPNTTGLATIDWRLVDARTDPPGAEAWCTERLARIDGCFLCYGGAGEHGPAPATPAPGDRAVTFGSFNSIRKIGPEVVRTWSALLRKVPGSRLLIKTRGIGTPAAKRNYLAAFQREGIDAARVDLLDGVPDKAAHLALYGRIDVGLDTFPYNGTTTTCEALWMGVPVVALEGRIHAGRVGVSLLHAAGLRELIGASTEDYIRIAAGLAQDRTRLATLRSSLRARLERSLLCDRTGFAERFEGAVRTMWRDWCAAAPERASP